MKQQLKIIKTGVFYGEEKCLTPTSVQANREYLASELVVYSMRHEESFKRL